MSLLFETNFHLKIYIFRIMVSFFIFFVFISNVSIMHYSANPVSYVYVNPKQCDVMTHLVTNPKQCDVMTHLVTIFIVFCC